ncbi:hypothetical protein C0989_007612 [Termitomyces sp. Mn162]|nr:hypothetical protein C0989_007612 [Termitomyces sp. Mn162]
MFFKSLTLLALSASALGNVFITSPTASTTFVAGQQATINWQDDGMTPSLKDFGPAKVSVYAGNAQQQTSLQLVIPSVDVSTTQSIQFTPDPFIRVESLNLKDSAAPQYPALAFSAKFTLNGMTGTFSNAVIDQINGQSTAPLAGATSAAAPVSKATTSPSLTTSTSHATSSATKSSASPTTTSNAAFHMKGSWVGIILGVVVGAAAF